MLNSWNINAVGTLKSNRKVFYIYSLNLDKNCEHVGFVIFYDMRICMIITWWKDSIILQTFSTAMKIGVVIVT